MTNRLSMFSTDEVTDGDVQRVADNAASRLRARGVRVLNTDSPDDILRILEALEEFERVVQVHGGDLMVDEPPGRGHAEPDERRFMLPRRARSESVSRYVARLAQATAAVHGKQT